MLNLKVFFFIFVLFFYRIRIFLNLRSHVANRIKFIYNNIFNLLHVFLLQLELKAGKALESESSVLGSNINWFIEIKMSFKCHLELFGANWSYLEPLRANWGQLEPIGAPLETLQAHWSHLKPFRTFSYFSYFFCMFPTFPSFPTFLS